MANKDPVNKNQANKHAANKSAAKGRCKTGPFSKEESKYVYELIEQGFSNEDIGERIGRRPYQIQKCRQKQSIAQVADERRDSIGLLHAKHFWPQIQKQFMDDEIQYFENEWAAYSLQFPDVVHTDESTICDAIRLGIQINRLLVSQKVAEEDKSRLADEIQQQYKLSPEIRDRDTIQKCRDSLSAIQSGLKSMSQEYQSLQKTKDEKFKALKANRDQRLKNAEESKTNFWKLLEKLNDDDNRREDNRMLSLVRDSSKKIKTEWMEPKDYADGSQDCILLSADTIEHLNNKEKEEETSE
jgi:hypothetical protein